MNYKQVTFAREFRGFSQTALANSIEGLSQSNLSNFEKGLSTLSEDLKQKITDKLQFPREFFDRKINISIENKHYRKKATIRKAIVDKFENFCKILGYVIDEMSEYVEWPSFLLQPLNVEEGFSPKYVANYTRKLLNIDKSEPIRNIITLLEKSGIIIYELAENEKFDGVSFITDKGFPIIVINKNFSNDRKRFTLAHELGHILMHNEFNFPISNYRDDKWKEKEANEFAGEFLMPEDEIKNSLRNLKISDLMSLKNYWLTSMSAIIRRAFEIGVITKDRYTFFAIEMSRRGYTKVEPGIVYIDYPKCFENGYLLLKNELNYGIKDFVHIFSLPEDIVTDIYSFNNPRLRIA